ncbi:class I SAM-dependent methyltransferase [Deltaproteobacteria bacterium TL4]
MQRNNFWDELCGTIAWTNLGLGVATKEALETFDQWYMDYYPYLEKYLPISEIKGKSILEIGLGYGTVGQLLFNSSARYVGVDFAKSPVDMMNQRILFCEKNNQATAIQGDARNLDFEDKTFDCVVSIGCLHHTGDFPKAVQEVFRVLKKGGKAIVMVYNRDSFRRYALLPMRYLINKIKKTQQTYHDFSKAAYDVDSNGAPPPDTIFSSRRNIKKYFSDFSQMSINTENFDDISIIKTGLVIPRKIFLNNVARLMGLDLYITAIK